ncbi:MscS mechanosensitive ion channel [Candidatus Scalindua japonica]|uniref:MscS mechanosensitive ion channel n=2 Tax=Candidatus Scalindua japonica TaxID=1284222 RepID=A0A286U2N0_9BACT|nr:MscS mechanosensitive ion channel [Candidatus Scalindua japonica]
MEETGSLKIPEEKPKIPSDGILPVEVARITLGHTKKRLDAYKNRLELIHAEKMLLNQQITHIESAQSAANAFVESLESMMPFLFEINLRVNDGTLASEEIPDLFNPQRMEIQKQKFKSQQNKLKKEAATTQQRLGKIAPRIEETRKEIFKAEAQHSSAREIYFQELHRQDLEQEYLRQTLERLQEKILELQKERVWLTENFNLSLNKFRSSQENVVRVQKELEELSKPKKTRYHEKHVEKDHHSIKKNHHASEKDHHTTAEKDHHKTIVTKEKISQQHGTRTKKLRRLRLELQSLIENGESLKGDAVILSEHLFKMQVIVEIHENSVVEGESVPDLISEGNQSDTIIAAGNSVSEYISEALLAVQKARDQLVLVDEQIAEYEAARKEEADSLASLKEIQESALHAKQWESTLKEMSIQQLVQSFKKSSEKLRENSITLQKFRDKFKKTQMGVEEAKQKLGYLKDPLLRLIQHEFLEEKQNILKKLFKLAGLNLPEELTRASFRSESSTAADKVNKNPLIKYSNNNTLTSQTVQYQNLLSTRIRIIEEQQKQRTKLLNVIKSLNQHVEQYVVMLSETLELAMKHHANAKEIKKRMGRGQLSSNEIPDGITEALSHDLIIQPETEITELLNYQTNVKRQIEELHQPDVALRETLPLLKEMRSLVSKRLDILRELQKQDQDFQQKREDLPETALKSLEQTALRHMESEDKIIEYFLSFVPSEQTKELSDLLRAYYVELAELGMKRENLKEQKGNTEHLIQLAEEEESISQKLLLILNKQAVQLIHEEEEEWIKIREQFGPHKAEPGHHSSRAKTGHHAHSQVPVLEKNKAALIKELAPLLFFRHMKIMAVNKWTRFFEQKLSPSGIEVEIDTYHEGLGALNAKASSIQRRIQYIAGHSPDELTKLEPDEKPETAIDMLQFLQGEIGVLRPERYKIRRQEIILILIKLVSIVLIAIFLVWLVKRVITRFMTSDIEKKPQTKFVLSFLKTFLKISIWIIAIVMLMSNLGFKVGAFLAGLGIGGLAIALAAKETLANILGGIMIFIERPFTIGDTIQIGSMQAGKVVDMTWRTTRLINPFDYHFSVPNSQVAESTILNYTKALPGGDYISVYVAPDNDPQKVIQLINQALSECTLIKQDMAKGTMLAGMQVFENASMMQYWPWWYADDYHKRYMIRDEVWNRIWKHLHEADIELKIRPFELAKRDNVTSQK